MSVYDNMVARYESGQIPWDDPLPPPEAIALITSLSPGKALDLGCGLGRASIYLASQGWDVDGVDFVPQAIEIAKQRANEAQVKPRFHCASVIDLDFLTKQYTFVLDVGCCHALTSDQLIQYHAHLKRLIQPDGYYLLFARIHEIKIETEQSDPPRGIDPEQIKALFQDGFRLDKMVKGETSVDDGDGWASAWFWYRRNR